MLRVFGCITGQHDLRLVGLAVLICLIGCYTTFSVLDRARDAGPGGAGMRWLSAGAVVAGATVWATHFIAILAYRPGVPVGFDPVFTVLSVTIAIGVTWAGLIAGRVTGSATLAGAAFGVAVVGMHYAGIAALEVPAIRYWDGRYVAASIVIAIGLGILSARIFARGRSMASRLMAANVMALAIAGLHFTAMTALDLEIMAPKPGAAPPTLPTDWMVVAVTLATALIVGLGFVGSVFDQLRAQREIESAQALRRHVAELEATKAQLEATTADLTVALEAAAQASQSKSQFLATMSHELRTPLNAIIGFAEVLQDEVLGPIGTPQYQDYAHDILVSGHHLLSLINDILDFAKIDAGKLDLIEEYIDLAATLGRVMRILGGQAQEAGLAFDMQVVGDLPPLRADERRIRQIALNLLSNAIKFTPAGGKVLLSAHCGADGGMAIAVTDTGIGMATDDIPLALERFGQIDSSLSRRYDGTGLGLPLTKRLAELHGGTLEIDSTVGVGTTVTVRLPAERVAQLSAVA